VSKKKSAKLTTNLNPLGNLLGAARDSVEARQIAAQAAQQQAFNQQMDMSRLQMDQQMHSARLNQLAGGSALGAAFSGGGTFMDAAAAANIHGTSAVKVEHVPITEMYGPDNRTIRQILQAETDAWLAPVTI